MYKEFDYVRKDNIFIVHLKGTIYIGVFLVQDFEFVKSTALSLPAKITSLTLFPTPSPQTRANLVSIDFSRIASDCAGGSLSTEAALV